MIQTESTPNPESLKFLSENIISAIGTEEFQKNDINKVANPFIKELLGFKVWNGYGRTGDPTQDFIDIDEIPIGILRN